MSVCVDSRQWLVWRVDDDLRVYHRAGHRLHVGMYLLQRLTAVSSGQNSTEVYAQHTTWSIENESIARRYERGILTKRQVPDAPLGERLHEWVARSTSPTGCRRREQKHD